MPKQPKVLRNAFVALGLSLGSLVLAAVPVVDAHDSYGNDDNIFHVPTEETRYDSAPIQSDPHNPQTVAVLLNKINALQQEMQELRGRLEVQANDLKLLTKEQQVLYQDLDKRLVKVYAGQTTKTVDSAQNNARSSKKELRKKSDGLAKNRITPPEARDPKADYQQAYKLITQKNYTKAITAMESFVKRYPSSQYIPNAYYWLGELYVTQGRDNDAAMAFNKVMIDYPDSTKVSGAMLKLGMLQYSQGNIETARKTLTKLNEQFPSSASARLATVRLKEMNAQSSGPA